MNIEISNHPEYETIVRKYQASQIIIDLESDAISFVARASKIEGFVKNFNSEGKTPLGFNENGKYVPLVADNTTKVDSNTGQYDENGDIGELDYIANFTTVSIAQLTGIAVEDLTVKDILGFILQSSVLKQDNLERFNK